jgi:hypothetical protein
VFIEESLGDVEGVDLVGLSNLAQIQLVRIYGRRSSRLKLLLTTEDLGGAMRPSLMLNKRH